MNKNIDLYESNGLVIMTEVLKQARQYEQWRQEQSKKPVAERCREARQYLRQA